MGYMIRSEARKLIKEKLREGEGQHLIECTVFHYAAETWSIKRERSDFWSPQMRLGNMVLAGERAAKS